MVKILVTGGNGFIARSYAEYNTEHELDIKTHKQLDLLDIEAVERCLTEGKYDVVLHCATYDARSEVAKGNKDKSLDINLRMYFNLAKFNDLYGKLIYFGSGAEKEEAVPHEPYAFAKYIMNEHSRLSHNIYNIRLYSVYGKYAHSYRIVNNLCLQAIKGEPLVVKENKTIYLSSIKDVCRSIDVVTGGGFSLLVSAVLITTDQIAKIVSQVHKGKKPDTYLEKDIKEILDYYEV